MRKSFKFCFVPLILLLISFNIKEPPTPLSFSVYSTCYWCSDLDNDLVCSYNNLLGHYTCHRPVRARYISHTVPYDSLLRNSYLINFNGGLALSLPQKLLNERKREFAKDFSRHFLSVEFKLTPQQCKNLKLSHSDTLVVKQGEYPVVTRKDIPGVRFWLFKSQL